MKVYQLTGVAKDGGPAWPYKPIYFTRERAERQKKSEIKAYTTVDDVVLYECPYIFTIDEIEVEE